MISFIASLPVWVYVVGIWGFLTFIMYAGYLLGLEVGMDKGHRAGFDLGKLMGSRELTNGGKK
jgi:hypothetical protein